MPTPAVTLRLRRFRRRFGITAPRVAIRPHHGWHWNLATAIAGAAIVAAMVWSVAQYGETAQLKAELASVREQLQAAREETVRLRSVSGTEQNAVEMERTAQRQLVSRLKALEAENVGLKEENALFERLVPPAAGNEAVVRVERLRVARESEGGQYRYRILLAFQASKQLRDFRGRLQFKAVISQEGRDQQLTFPAPTEAAGDYQVEIHHFLRKDGILTIPRGARLKSVEAYVFQGDTLKAKGLAQL